MESSNICCSQSRLLMSCFNLVKRGILLIHCMNTNMKYASHYPMLYPYPLMNLNSLYAELLFNIQCLINTALIRIRDSWLYICSFDISIIWSATILIFEHSAIHSLSFLFVIIQLLGWDVWITRILSYCFMHNCFDLLTLNYWDFCLMVIADFILIVSVSSVFCFTGQSKARTSVAVKVDCLCRFRFSKARHIINSWHEYKYESMHLTAQYLISCLL